MNFQDSGGPLLIPMVCPHCGKDLEAGPGDRVGLCMSCRRAHFLGGAGGSFPLMYFHPVSGGTGKPKFLPFWKLEASWEIRCEPVKARAYSRFPARGTLVFPAFWRPSPTYSADLTWRLFGLAQLPPLGPGEEPLPGGVRSPEVIPEMARLSLLSYMDRLADVDGVDLRIAVGSLEYVGYPFWGDPEGWMDGILGVRFPSALFPG